MRDLANRMEEFLEGERQAILDADFTRLEAILPAKQKLFEELREAPPHAANWRRIHALAQRNQSLLGAARKGVESAIECVRNCRSRKGELVTYCPSGRRLSIRGTGDLDSRC